MQAIDRQHHVGGVHGMNQVGNDTVYLFSRHDPSFLIFLIQQNLTICGLDSNRFGLAVFMDHGKTHGSGPHHASILIGDGARDATKPCHDAAGLYRDLGNALLQYPRQIHRALYRVLACLQGLLLDQ